MKERKNKKKYIFFLNDINTEDIDRRFGMTITSNINESSSQNPDNTTKISDLSTNKNIPEIVSFLDEAKKLHNCTISMVDFYTKKQISEDSNQLDCFWCRNTIPNNIYPIGCPIKFVQSQVVKKYYSEISKDKYTIKENITSSKIKEIKNKEDNRLNIIDKNYYMTDGIFCSFNCCMSYILENKTNSMYILSEMLLLKMYNDIYPSKIPSIDKAPHWRKLKQYGGDLNIEEFRDSFNKIEYKNYGFISDIPKFKSLGVLFEEKLKF
jgi:hypothetical protein